MEKRPEKVGGESRNSTDSAIPWLVHSYRRTRGTYKKDKPTYAIRRSYGKLAAKYLHGKTAKHPRRRGRTTKETIQEESVTYSTEPVAPKSRDDGSYVSKKAEARSETLKIRREEKFVTDDEPHQM